MQRKVFSAEFKAKVALEALARSLSDMETRFG
jgi:hypothetical protein